jgi:hypothetical protein
VAEDVAKRVRNEDSQGDAEDAEKTGRRESDRR